jgi:thiosulfate dehydrogenase (quinone) large subunit
MFAADQAVSVGIRRHDAQEDTMSITRQRGTSGLLPSQDGVHPDPAGAEALDRKLTRYAMAAARISLGWIFLWAFLDKTFGLGHETAHADAWIRGGSPTKGFLAFGAAGPFTDLYHSIAGSAWADWLFMAGLLGLGIALLLGVAMRLAAASGALLLVLMWTVVLPPANNPFMDDHLVYAILLVVLAAAGAGTTLGLSTTWGRIPLVRRHGWLR